MIENVNYTVVITQRDGQGQINDDFHAEVTRLTDGKQLVFNARWLWLIKHKTRRKGLDKAFSKLDNHDRKMGTTYQYDL